MTKQQYIELLRNSVEVWNQWRKEHPEIHPDLSGADLSHMDLTGARFSFANLTSTVFAHSNLSNAYFVSANLLNADLSNTILDKSNLNRACLVEANLSNARVDNAKIALANLTKANLCKTSFQNTNFDRVIFDQTLIENTDLSFAKMRWLTLTNVNLATAIGLDTVTHGGPTHMDIYSAFQSIKQMSDEFMRGIGQSTAFSAYIKSVTKEMTLYSTCLIIHASEDKNFIKKLQASLDSKKVFYKSTAYETENNSYMEEIINSIQVFDRILLVLSEHSERDKYNHLLNTVVKTVLEKESSENLTILHPLQIYNSFDICTRTWARLIKQNHKIKNFIDWEDDNVYQEKVDKLLKSFQLDHF